MKDWVERRLKEVLAEYYPRTLTELIEAKAGYYFVYYYVTIVETPKAGPGTF